MPVKSTVLSTGAAALTATQVESLVSYAADLAHLGTLPPNVASAVAVLVMAVGHAIYVRFVRRDTNTTAG